MADQPQEPDLSLLAKIPDRDLEEIVAAIQEGAQQPGEALGFGDDALTAIEKMAVGFYRAKIYDKASVIYGFILQMNQDRGSAWRGLGACCHALRSYPLAVKCYRRAVEKDDADIVSRVFWGECLCQVGEKENGLELLQHVIDKGTDNLEYKPYITRARAIVGAGGGVPNKLVLMKEGQRLAADAAELIGQEGGPAFDPDAEITVDDIKANPELNKMLGELRSAVEEGKLTYAEIGGFTENELDGAYACACKYAEMGQTVQAIQIGGYLMFLDPYNGRYYQLIGICLQQMKQYENADHYYKMALLFDEENPMTLVYRGEAKIMAGKTDEGLELVKLGVAAAGEQPDCKELADRGEVLLRQFGS
jgi:tetratricopeptide (TPR) repeat protein